MTGWILFALVLLAVGGYLLYRWHWATGSEHEHPTEAPAHITNASSPLYMNVGGRFQLGWSQAEGIGLLWRVEHPDDVPPGPDLAIVHVDASGMLTAMGSGQRTVYAEISGRPGSRTAELVVIVS